MDPATAIFVGASVAKPLLTGMSQNAQAQSEADRMDSEARLADTQALQRDTNLRDELTRFLSTTQSSRAANGLSATSPNALKLMSEANLVSSRERTRQTADDKQRAANLRAGASARRRGGRMSLLTGAIGAAVPLAQNSM